MCVSLQPRTIKNFQVYVSLQRRVQKCMKQVSDVHGTSRHTKIIVSPQFWKSDDHAVTKGLPVHGKNLRFTFSDVRPARSEEKVGGRTKKLRFTTVLSVRRSLFALRVARPREKIAFHHSFERPTFTVNGCSAI